MIKKYRTTLSASLASVVRDILFIFPLDGRLKSLITTVKAFSYIVSSRIRINKLLTDWTDWNRVKDNDTLNKEAENVGRIIIGYPVSMIENLLKTIRNIFKAGFEIADTMLIIATGSPSSKVKELKKEFAKIETQIRLEVLVIVDFIEDFFNAILYDLIKY